MINTHGLLVLTHTHSPKMTNTGGGVTGQTQSDRSALLPIFKKKGKYAELGKLYGKKTDESHHEVMGKSSGSLVGIKNKHL